MLRILLLIEEKELEDNVADMIACSTDEILFLMMGVNATPTCSKTLQHCIIYPLSYAALKRFIEALSNLTRSRTFMI